MRQAGEIWYKVLVINKGHILLADDEEDFLKFTAALFRKEGYECDCARDADEAVALVRGGQYDVVISDIRMPGNPDLRLAREVASTRKGVPVILVTGYPSFGTAVRAVELPVVSYVEKPVEFADLLSRVKSAIIHAREQLEVANKQKCRLGQCDKLDNLANVISETTDKLKLTKKAFKSKQLGRLRERLDSVVQQLEAEEN